jgi:hypothetical protein
MAVAYDAESSIVVGTGDRNWSHNPVGTPRGVLVIIVHEVGTDTVVGVTYDGTALNEVALSPLLHTTPETGSVHAFFLGVGVPTADPATVAVDVSDTSDWIAAAYTVTAGGDTVVHDTTTFDSVATTTPSATLTITVNSFVAGGLYSGLGAPGFTEVAGTVLTIEDDLGNDSATVSRGDSIKTTDFAYGWTQASDDGAVLAVAIAETPNKTFNAEVATATGTANNATTLETINAGVATGTGAALTPSLTVAPPVEVATGTGATLAASLAVVAESGFATATGAALTPSASIVVNAGLATATGVANDATVDVSGASIVWGAWSETWSNEVDLVTVNAGVAAGTGLANAASLDIQPPAGIATATGLANAAALIVSPTAGVATGTGAALGITADIVVNPGVATGTGAALAPSAAIVVNAGVATGAGLANDATVTVGADATVNAGVATGTGTAYQPSLIITPNAGVATALAAAYDTSGTVGVFLGVATGTGQAYDAIITTTDTPAGGFPPIGYAISFIQRVTGHAPKPNASASGPTPGGSASNPKPR